MDQSTTLVVFVYGPIRDAEPPRRQKDDRVDAEPEPMLPLDARFARRDPAVVISAGRAHCFHTVVDTRSDPPALRIDVTTSDDLVHWSEPVVAIDGPENFSSPGNVVRAGDEWVLFLQSYPIDPGAQYGNAECRLWSSRSADLVTWSAPEPLRIEGAAVRRIDPFVHADADGFHCLHKRDGAIVDLVSTDLRTWRTAPGGPVLDPAETPEGVEIENPSVLTVDGDTLLLYAPCRPGRGVGVARGPALGRWHDIRALDLPRASWAPDGFTAPVLMPAPDGDGWALFVHGETTDAHGGGLTVLRSPDLRRWR